LDYHLIHHEADSSGIKYQLITIQDQNAMTPALIKFV